MDSKTEVFNWDQEFVWLEDYPFNFEIEQLKTFNRLDSLFTVDLTRKNELINVKNEIHSKFLLHR